MFTSRFQLRRYAMSKIWIVDDEPSILEKLEKILSKRNYTITCFNKPEDVFEALKIEQPSLIIADLFYKNSQNSGESIVSHVLADYSPTQVIIISGETDFKKTLSALNSGAIDFIEKPLSLPRLLTTIKNGLSIYENQKERFDKYRILGNSSHIKELKLKVRKLATLNEPILIHGESGVGKELVAQNLHLYSSRSSTVMKEINCTAFNNNLIESELFGHVKGSFTGASSDKIGIFEKANASSLFIDEIGDLPLEVQTKLLRVLQDKKITPVGETEERSIDSRLIFATHRNLRDRITEGSFREDFFFRISTFSVEIPPLRERIEDIDQLAPYFLQKFLTENGLPYKEFATDSLGKLKEFDYRGNIRELIQIVKNAAFFSNSEIVCPDDITFSHTSEKDELLSQTQNMSFADAKSFFEREFLRKRLSLSGNKIGPCAESLGIIRNNLYRMLKKHNIEWKE